MSGKSPPPQLEAGLPNAVDAEKTLLGAVLLDNQAWPDIAALSINDWFLESHRRIRMSMKRLHDSGSSIDIVTMANDLASRHEIEAVGGVAYLASLTEGLPRRPAIEDYIKIVRDKGMLRILMLRCSQAVALAADQSTDALGVIGPLQNHLEQIIQPIVQTSTAPARAFMPGVIKEVMDDFISKTQPTIPSGNPWFDAKTGGGYRRGRYTIVGARPKIGKSSWGITSTAYNCQRGTWVDWFSLEMDQKELSLNLVPYLTDIPNVVCVRPWLRRPDQQDTVLTALETIENEWPLEINDGEMDCDQICWSIDRRAKKAAQESKEILFILDHFGLIAGGDKDIRKRYVDHSERLRKKIKAHKNAALLVLFQLNEVAREYADKRPQRGDIGESKKPLQDCFAALWLHRYQDKETLKTTTKTNLNLELLRGGGSPGNIDGEFDVRRLCFDVEPELDYESQDWQASR